MIPEQTAKIATNCIRTLLLTNPKTPADNSIARYLLPHLLAFTTNTTPEDPTSSRALISQILTTFTTTLPASQKPIAMSIILPTLLKRASGELESENDARDSIFRETSSRLLELAASDQTAFRSIVAGLTSEQRGFMESVILAGRSAAASSAKDTSGEDEGKEPTIALKAFGA